MPLGGPYELPADQIGRKTDRGFHSSWGDKPAKKN